MARLDALGDAVEKIAQRKRHENVCKLDTLSAAGVGTHKQARQNDHKRTQRSIEYYEAKATMLRNGGYSALTSMDRQEIRIAACLLCEHTDTMGGALPTRCPEIVAAYRSSSNRTALLAEWVRTDWAALGLLWLGGVKGQATAAAIVGIFATKPAKATPTEEVDVLADLSLDFA